MQKVHLGGLFLKDSLRRVRAEPPGGPAGFGHGRDIFRNCLPTEVPRQPWVGGPECPWGLKGSLRAKAQKYFGHSAQALQVPKAPKAVKGQFLTRHWEYCTDPIFTVT